MACGQKDASCGPRSTWLKNTINGIYTNLEAPMGFDQVEEGIEELRRTELAEFMQSLANRQVVRQRATLRANGLFAGHALRSAKAEASDTTDDDTDGRGRALRERSSIATGETDDDTDGRGRPLRERYSIATGEARFKGREGHACDVRTLPQTHHPDGKGAAT
eukprot:4324750-Prymnesium_polylepis.1